jgi:hypothetical protein
VALNVLAVVILIVHILVWIMPPDVALGIARVTLAAAVMWAVPRLMVKD